MRLLNIPVVLTFALLFALGKPAFADEIHLTRNVFEEKTKDKTVFLKFYAPWCGHCKELAPKWERVSKEWGNNNPKALVGSVDCTQEEEFCVSLGVQGFPTLLYGDPSQGGLFLEVYSGDKTYEALSDFANETLRNPVCSPGNPSLCDGPAREQIEKFWSLSSEDLQASIRDKELLIEKEETDFKDKFDEMQANYDKQSQEHEFKVAKMKSNIRLLKSFLVTKT